MLAYQQSTETTKNANRECAKMIFDLDIIKSNGNEFDLVVINSVE